MSCIMICMGRMTVGCNCIVYLGVMEGDVALPRTWSNEPVTGVGLGPGGPCDEDVTFMRVMLSYTGPVWIRQ